MNIRVVLGVLLLLFFLGIAIFEYRKRRDLFSPLVLFSIFGILRYVPGLMYIDSYLGLDMTDKNSILVFFFESLFVTFVLIGYYFAKQFKRNKKPFDIHFRDTFSLNCVALFLYAIGFAFGLLYIHRIGGFSLVIHGDKIYTGGNGNSYIRAMMFLMIVGICLLIQNNIKEKRLVYKLCLWSCVILLFMIYSFFFFIQTSRSPVLEALLIIVMVYNYQGKRIRITDLFKPKAIIVFLIIAAYIIVMPYVRGLKGTETVSVQNGLAYAFNNITDVFKEFCYTTRDGFIYENFNESNFWYGSNLINLICAPLPSSIFAWKPPVDDGMYLANASIGYFVRPPSSDLPWYNSYPLSSPGGLYINFGVFGLVVGGLLFGMLYNFSYQTLERSKYDFVFVIIYQLIIYQLEFSSLSIVQTLTPLVITYLSVKIFAGYRITNRLFDERISSQAC